MSRHRAGGDGARRSGLPPLPGRITAFGVVVALALSGAFTSTVAWAFWTAGTLPGGNTTSTAATVGAGALPTAVAGPSSVVVSWSASTLSTGTSVSGYTVNRYDAATLTQQTTLTGCSGLVTALTCTETTVPDGAWRYSITPRFATNWVGAESAKSTSVSTESTPPVNAITLSNVTGSAVKSGNTVYYRGTVAGSFTLTNTLTDAGSGPASSATAALGGTSTGWSHSPTTVTTPAGGPYVSAPFSWTAGAASSPTEVVTGRDVIGNAATTTLTFVDDVTGPTGSVSYTDGFRSAPSVNVALTATDAGSGLASAQLQRASALYVGTVGGSSSGATGGTGCASFTAFAAIGPADPTTPYIDSAVTNSTCYQYRYLLTDALGNSGSVTSSNVAIVDYAGAVGTTAGLLSQWRLGESAATASRAADTVGGNIGDYVGGVSLGVGGELARDANTAVTLNGTTGYLQVASPSGLPASSGAARSVELWFRTTSSSRQALFNYGTLANGQSFGLLLDAGGTTMTAFGYGAAANKVFTMPSALNNGAWHHVVTTYDGSLITLYIDGSGLAPQAATRATTLNANGLSIGAILPLAGDADSGRYFAGSIDEVSVYTTALTAGTVTNHYAIGKNAFSDIVGPTGGSLAASGLVGTGSAYATSTAGSVAFTKGTDAPSGLASTGTRLMSATAPLTSAGGTANGTCGTFTAFTTVSGGNDPASPAADTMADQTCYAYQYVVPDTLYNYTRYSATTVVKVDTTAPSLNRTVVAGTNSYVSGSTVYYRGAVAGGFTVNSGATDPASGIASVAYPSLGTGWTTPGTGLSQTYSWTANPAVAAGAKNVTATNNAGLTSPASTFTPVLDSAAPTGFSIYVTGAGAARQTGYVTGTDAGSGIASIVWERQNSLLCLLYGGFEPVAQNPEPLPPNLGCVNYRLTVTDNVGNVFTASQIV